MCGGSHLWRFDQRPCARVVIGLWTCGRRIWLRGGAFGPSISGLVLYRVAGEGGGRLRGWPLMVAKYKAVREVSLPGRGLGLTSGRSSSTSAAETWPNSAA